jgi:outer membrane protein assembly factor BamD
MECRFAPAHAMTVLSPWRQRVPMPVLPVAALCAALWLGGCASQPEDDTSRVAVETLYAEAKEDMGSGSYDRAITTLQRIEGRAAGTLLAQQAQLDLAYSLYRTGDRAQSLSTLDRFIRLNPSSPALDYAFYLRGVVNFNDNLGILGRLSNQELSERDQQASREAYEAFRQLVDQFPQSRYSGEARDRMDYIVNALADYEVHVARYYYRRGAFVAAANRAQQAVQDYRQTPATEEALYILVQSYDQLGLVQLRDDADRVLKANFPDSAYLREGVRQRGGAWWQFW